MQFNYNVKPLDIGAYFRGLDRYEAQQKEKQSQEQQEQLQKLGQSFLGGDASALDEIAAINLPYAAQLQQFQQSQAPQAPSDDEILGAMESAASFLRSGQVASAQQSIQQLIPRLQNQAQQQEMLSYIQQMETDPQGLLAQYDSVFGGGEFMSKTIGGLQVDESGREYFVSYDPNTGEPQVQYTGKSQLTPEEKQTLKVSEAREVEKARLDEQAQDKTLTSWREARSLNSKRKQQLKIAERVIDNATQGLMAPVENFFSKLGFPIDMTQEGALDSAFTQFALQELQSFKGPTTDFEFGVSERVAGRITDPKTSNKAKLGILKATAWLEDEKQRQFSQFRQQKGNKPTDFRFDENRKVKINGKEMTIAEAFDDKLNIALGVEPSKKDDGSFVIVEVN